MLINFNEYKFLNNYKFLYLKKSSCYNEDYYEIWADSEEKLRKIANKIMKQPKYLKSFGWCDTSLKVKKNFMPVPDWNFRQSDGNYHAYISIILKEI